MLVQVALIVFGLCALMSAVIDLGYARLTQGQMQNAADSAAIEGLRQRNVGADAFESDCLRRAAANRMIRRTFDDDVDLLNGDPGNRFGAGPVLELTEGVTSVHALQTLSIGESRVYKPSPQLNQQNVAYGDMVSGRSCYVSNPIPSEGGDYALQDLVCDEPQRGTGSYARNDFNPAEASPQPPTGLAECPAPDDETPNPWPTGGTGSLAADTAFLVRLRRSNDLQDQAGQVEPGVASSGPALPLTFGKGAAIHGDDPDGGYSVRRDGLTVRATAIARVRPALHLGVPQTDPATPSLTPFVLRDVCLEAPAAAAANAAVAINVTINPTTGTITRAAGPAPASCPANTVMGRFVPNQVPRRRVGQPVPVAGTATPCASAASFTGRYGPVYAQMSSGPPDRIIGFARIDFTRVATCPASATAAFTATMTRRASSVAPSNATALLPAGFFASVPSALVTELIEKNLRTTYAPVLVPILAR